MIKKIKKLFVLHEVPSITLNWTFCNVYESQHNNGFQELQLKWIEN